MKKIPFRGIRILMLFAILFLTACRDNNASAQQGKSTTVKPPDTDIHTAVATGKLDLVQLHIKAGTDINLKDPMGGSSPLITAALYDQREIAAYLIKAGAKINVQNNDGSTALHVAAFFCKPEILKILLAAGADKQIKNKYGDTPLKIVSAPFSEVKGIYVQMKQMLEPIGVKIDLVQVEKLRPEMAVLLK
jgi:hypothetical protein